MSSRLALLAVIPVAVVVFLVTRPGGTHRATHPRYYLSLGDSLSQGMEPNSTGLTVDTANGYADQLRALEAKRIPGLKLVKLGCGGENTFSMLSGRQLRVN